MNLLPGFLRRGRPETEDRSITIPAQRPTMEMMASSGHAVSVDSALSLADVYACIRAICDTGATIPLHTYQASGEGRVRVRPNGFNVAGLMEAPSPTMTQATFISAVLANLNTWGNAYVAKYRKAPTPTSSVVQLALIPPHRVTVSVVAGEPVYEVAPGSDNLKGTFGRGDVIHFKAMSLDGVVGLSPISQTRNAIGVGVALEDAAGRDYANGSAPGGVIEVVGEVTPEAFHRFRKDWETAHRGTQNRGRVAFLESGWKWQPIGLPASDAQFVEQRRLSSTQIARIFRVPPEMIGADAGSSMTYSNVEQATASYLMHTIRPWLVVIEQTLAADPDLYPPDGSVYPEFAMDALLRADTATRFAAYATAVGGPWMTRNEARTRENLPTVSGGDELASTPTPTPAAT